MGSTRRRDEKAGENSEGREGREEGFTQRRNDATTRQGFLEFWLWRASGWSGLGWFEVLVFYTGAVEVY